MGRSNYATQRGEQHPNHKLTAEDVRAIRQSDATTRALAAFYGVSQTTIVNIQKERTWTHV